MKPISAFQYFCLTHFGKPVADRKVFKMIAKKKFHSFIEVGLGDGTRSEKMIRVAKKFGVTDSIRYTGVDLFEGRPENQTKLSLREMHKRLSSSGAKVQLVPGELLPALARIANSHVRTDLVIISAEQTESDLDDCWFYFPRMLHAGSQVLIQNAEGNGYRVLSRLDIERKTENKPARRAA